MLVFVIGSVLHMRVKQSIEYRNRNVEPWLLSWVNFYKNEKQDADVGLCMDALF